MAKKKMIIHFPENLWKAEGYTFQQKVIFAFHGVIPRAYKIELDKMFIRLYKCTSCRPVQHLVVDEFDELVAARNGNQEAFELIVDLDEKLLV